MNRAATMIAGACIALATSVTAVPAAQAFDVKCDKSPYDVDLAVVHANGMLTTMEGARANLEHLRPLVDQRLGQQGYAISYAIAYDEKKGYLESLLKLIRERSPMSTSVGIRMLSGLSELPEDLSDALRSYATDLVSSGFEDDASLAQQIQMYREHLRSGHKVVVIAHSEGNMYANAAYRQLFNGDRPEPGEDDFGIVGVALPAVSIAGWHPSECPSRGCYTTLQQDKVITAATLAFPDTAPANVFTKIKNGDGYGHGLIESYLANPEARAQILDQVAWFVDRFGPLTPSLHDSSITAHLEWDSSADLDLHVFEGGGGEHVYPDYPDGGGHIDVDDRDGYGPEHYYGECALLRHGDFRFAVGYYSGPGPTTARLRVKVGSLVRTYTRTLPGALGPDTLSDPETFAIARVTNSKDTLAEDYEIDLASVPAPR